MRDDDPVDRFDALIDEAARSLTEARPPMSLPAVVRQRIDRPAPGWRVSAWPGSAAAAVLVVVAMLWFGRSASPPDGVVRAVPVASAPSPVVVDLTPRRPSAPEQMTALQRESRARVFHRQTQRRFIGPAVGPAMIDLQLVRLAEEPAITVERVEIQPLLTEPLLTEQLSTDRLEMERMESPMPLRAERLEIEPITIQ